jgi:hypothetical protein
MLPTALENAPEALDDLIETVHFDELPTADQRTSGTGAG